MFGFGFLDVGRTVMCPAAAADGKPMLPSPPPPPFVGYPATCCGVSYPSYPFIFHHYTLSCSVLIAEKPRFVSLFRFMYTR